jgi:hypothetical protein
MPGTGIIVSLLLGMIISGFSACEVLDYELLEPEETITVTQLRENWNRLIVYHRPNAGLVFKLKNDKIIQLPGKWVEVASEEELTDKQVLYSTDVRRILGQDGVLFGYLLLAAEDHAFVRVVNGNTVELIYNHRVQRVGR